MSDQRILQAISAGLRGLTLVIRFGFMLYIANRLTLTEVGIFGLYVAALMWASSMLGLEVYATATRQLLEAGSDARQVLRSHLGFLLIVLAFGLPLLALLYGLLPDLPAGLTGLLLALFALHLACELVALDLGRLLIPVGRVFAASVLLFVRSALWMVLVVAAFEVLPESRNPQTIFLLWLLGSIVGAVAGYGMLVCEYRVILDPVFDSRWIMRAVKASGLIFLGTVLFRLLTNADRFAIELLLDTATVGLYTIYIGVCFGFLSLIEAGVSVWHYAAMVKDLQAADHASARERLVRYVRQNTLSVLVVGAAVGMAFPVLAAWLLPAPYSTHIAAFWLMLFGMMLYGLSLPAHYFIYGMKRDSMTVSIYLVASLVFFGFAPWLFPTHGIEGVGALMGVAFGTIALGRGLALGWLLTTVVRGRVQH